MDREPKIEQKVEKLEEQVEDLRGATGHLLDCLHMMLIKLLEIEEITKRLH